MTFRTLNKRDHIPFLVVNRVLCHATARVLVMRHTPCEPYRIVHSWARLLQQMLVLRRICAVPHVAVGSVGPAEMLQSSGRMPGRATSSSTLPRNPAGQLQRPVKFTA